MVMDLSLASETNTRRTLVTHRSPGTRRSRGIRELLIQGRGINTHNKDIIHNSQGDMRLSTTEVRRELQTPQ